MNETEFNQLADELMLSIEESIDDSGADIDYENTAGVMTLTIEANGSKVIVSRQPAMAQIWVAAKSGGYYFNLSGNSWACTTTGETLQQLLRRVCEEQGEGGVVFSF
ncbi:MAG: iron donor protein CyaY [Porticoccus sp.]